MSTNGLELALQLLDAAQRELDERGAPADIGAQLDLVICRLKDIMEEKDQIGGPANRAADAAIVVRN